MVHVIHHLPELEELERTYIQCLIGRMSPEQILMFAKGYRRRRKDPYAVLLASIIGLIAFPGSDISRQFATPILIDSSSRIERNLDL